MSIIFDTNKQVFLLNTPNSTYAIRIYRNTYVLHGGWFDRIDAWSDLCVPPIIDRCFAPRPADVYDIESFSPDFQPSEFSTAGVGDFRMAAFEADLPDGSNVTKLVYKSYKIIKGKPALENLPATYTVNNDEADTLELYLEDTVSNIEVTLSYTVWNTKDVICRHTVVKNLGKEITLRRVMSTSVDFLGSRYKLLQLMGSHARERHVVLRELEPGLQGIDSRRNASSHQANPFIALLSHNADETSGCVYGFSFVYSGSFTAQAEVDQYNMTRVQVGLNQDTFAWKLETGQSFCTPEVVMVRSNKGLGQMSRTYHELYRNNLCRGLWKTEERPIVINNWEATFFDFSTEKLLSLADSAKSLGIEMFVLDDGWFGNRFDDRRALGDWVVNEQKLQGGLKGLADKINIKKMKFGLWIEPEMISPDSELYRNHPDWCIHIEGRDGCLSRNQKVLDLSKPEVVDYLIDVLSNVFSSANIEYVKWDYNRSPTEVNLFISHKYMLGLYRLLETLTTKFPSILFESCSGGGGRFDPGMLYYMPQTWTSDNTDAISRVQIQMGTSVVYPASAMSCHVSAVPNQQVGRITPIEQRGAVAMAGTFGYELDLTKLSQNELDQIKEQVELYKKIRPIVQFGDLYRLETPWAHASKNEATDFVAWENVSKDKKCVVFTVVWTYSEANVPPEHILLQGLKENTKYKVVESSIHIPEWYKSIEKIPTLAGTKGLVYNSDELMNAGLFIQFVPELGQSVQIVLEEV